MSSSPGDQTVSEFTGGKVRAVVAVVCIFNISRAGAVSGAGWSMEEPGKIILVAEGNSSKFNDKVLVMNDGDTVKVSRSNSEDKPDTRNAVFDCRVSSYS